MKICIVAKSYFRAWLLFLGLLERSLGKNPCRNTREYPLFSPAWKLISFIYNRILMADVNENLEKEELQSIIFLLSNILPKERMARATVSLENYMFNLQNVCTKNNYTKLNIHMHIAWSKICYFFVLLCACLSHDCSIAFLIELSRCGGGVGEVRWSILW